MSKKDLGQNTEKRIKRTAMALFFGQGKFKLGTQEIADVAGVNRTSINYYFRSRNNLFKIVFQEALEQMHTNDEVILESDLGFREKLEKWIDAKLASSIKYPFLEIYIVSEMKGQNDELIKKAKGLIGPAHEILSNLLKEEIKKGTIKPIDPIHFILNIASLVAYPMCLRPLLLHSLDLNEEDYNKILSERKQVILDTVFI